MHLEHEHLLAFPGLNGMQGICHIRAYEAPGYRPVVITGELTDNPGTFIPNAIETLAYTIQTELYPDGRGFQLIQHRPRDEFFAIDFQHRSTDEDPDDPAHLASTTIIIAPDEQQHTIPGPKKPGDFRDPHWTRIDAIETLLRCTVLRFEPEELHNRRDRRSRGPAATRRHRGREQTPRRRNRGMLAVAARRRACADPRQKK